MKLSDFKLYAQLYGECYDNSEQAGKEWARTWGFSYWRSAWFYKEYKLGGFIYRTGMWRGRHGGRNVTECEINGEQVSKYRFLRALATFEVSETTASKKMRQSANMEAMPTQLTMEFV